MDYSSKHVKELAETGKRLFASAKHSEAVNSFSEALKIAEGKDEQIALLLDRSQALTGLATYLKGIPASQSEAGAIFALDPTTLAQLGLADAKKANLLAPACIKAYAQQGQAYILLESYVEAQKACLEGLAVDPVNLELQQLLSAVRVHLAGSRPSSPELPAVATASRPKRKVKDIEDAECVLCIKLLFEPVTTPCGHSFCRSCFLRSTDHSSKCPMCRAVLHVGREIPVTLALRQLIERSFPEEYEARRQEESGWSPTPGREAPMPLFVMSCILPGEKMRLNIFEPRYRLMIRRCMEGSRRFGMALVSRSGELHNTACEVEIVECQPVPDGRYLLEIEGKRRFTLARSWEQDGYRVGQPVFFIDEAAQAQQQDQLDMVASEVVQLTDTLLEQLRSASRSGGRTRPRSLDILRQAGQRPASTDYEPLSFWLANLLPLDISTRLQMLSCKSSFERMRMCIQIFSADSQMSGRSQ